MLDFASMGRVFLLAVLFWCAAPSVAHADDATWGFELNYSPAKFTGAFSGATAPNQPGVSGYAEYFLLRNLGKLGIGLGWGYIGEGPETPIPPSSLNMMRLGLSYRLDYFNNQYLVPFVRVANYPVSFLETDTLQLVGQPFRLHEYAFGVELLLDWLDPRAAARLSQELGIQNLYFTAEYLASNGPFATYSFKSFQAGLRMEFGPRPEKPVFLNEPVMKASRIGAEIWTAPLTYRNVYLDASNANEDFAKPQMSAQIFGDYFLFSSLGKLGLCFGTGQVFPEEFTPTSQNVAEVRAFEVWFVDFGLSYHFDYIDHQLFVPYVRATRSFQWATEARLAGDTFHPLQQANVFAAGIQLSLDWFDRVASTKRYSEYGAKDLYVMGEYQVSNSLGALPLSYTTVRGGVRVEF